MEYAGDPMNQQVDRSEKLKKKLRVSETARVKVQRESDANIIRLAKLIDLLEAKVKDQKKEIKKLTEDRDAARREICDGNQFPKTYAEDRRVWSGLYPEQEVKP